LSRGTGWIEWQTALWFLAAVPLAQPASRTPIAMAPRGTSRAST
jgi:hypothetical protein